MSEKHNNCIDNKQVTDILTIDPIVLGKYIRLTPVHDLSRIARKKDMCFLCSSLYGFHSIKQFLDMYKEFCVSHQKKLSDGQKHRYGWAMDILLPRREWSDNSLKKFVSEFVKGIIGKERFIRYIAYKYRTGKRNDVQRVRIWFCDRECYPIPGKSRYKRDYYQNKNTHKFCKSTDPNAELAYRKGEIIRDSEEHMFSATKSRILNIKQDDFQSFRVWLAGYFENVLKTCGIYIEQKKYRFKRIDIWKAMGRYDRRTAVAQNRAIIYVENEINRIYEAEYAKAPLKMVTFSDPVNPKIKGHIFFQIQELYKKYMNIFKKMVFSDGKKLFHLNTRNCMINEQASYRLIQVFKSDVNNLNVFLE